MVVGEASINNIMGGIENTGSVRLHNHKRKLKQRFDIIKKLGQGTYGKVQLGINKETGQEVAIKTIKKSKIETEADLIRIRREIQIMSSVQHPNIIHIYEVFENREKMVLVMEYAAGGELYDYLSERKVLPEEEARRIFRQISTACYYCHKHKICHRDLKLENILLDENKNAKIADFGLSNVFDDHRLLSTFCGSPLYASPEIVKGTPYHGPEADCWSLGVLLYTLVYGAMPFDGSNFKRLVKQISQGDYFEPKNPSPASPLIQEMLTVNAKNRANIEKICAHWWVNEGYEESCLDISEDLANQTPVRLDVLLSLNPPPPQLESDQMVVAGEANDEQMKAEPAVPTRSQSVGSLMDISNPAEKRIKEMIAAPPKRKLETTVSTEQANVSQDGKRKEKITKERTIADISVSGQNQQEQVPEDVKMTELPVNNGNDGPTEMEDDPNLQGAACTELLEEAKKKQPSKVKKTMSMGVNNKILEEINENPSQENLHNDKENKPKAQEVAPVTTKPEQSEKEKDPKTPVKKKIVKKKVLSDKNEVAKPDAEEKRQEEEKKKEEIPAEAPAKPVERRQSRIFEQAEKFQSMIQDNKAPNASPEKPKKIIIPGVSVGGFKKEFERKASLKNVSPPKIKTALSKKHVIEDKATPVPEPQEQKPADVPPPVAPTPAVEVPKPTPTVEEKKVEVPQKVEAEKKTVTMPPQEEKVKEEEKNEDAERKLKMKNAVSIISNALDKEGARKSKSRPCMTRKPPVPFGASGRSASGSIAMISSQMSPPADKQRFLKMQPILPLSSTPEQAKNVPTEPAQPENQTSSAEITLKSATLPRRKSTKAEIQLDYPKPKPAQMEFKTEMAHQVQAPPPTLSTQRSEVMFPVNTPPISIGLRSSSLEPDNRSRERIIPIAFEKTHEQPREPLQSPPTKPPVPRVFQTQKSTSTQRSNSLSRQSTQESDSETAASGDPIKKSPREYIIPIAVEGGGYVTPRAGSLEPSETSSTITNSSRKTTSSKFSRPRRMMSLFDRDGSEDESPFGTLHRHHSFGKDSDTEGDSRKDSFHMHRLRSSRPRKATLEHNDSLSSGEDDDDEDGFEFLTAENLFSTLLSRVRGLTQRINTDENPRAGFPNSRLLSHFDHGNFWNRMEPLGSRNSPLGRQFSRERSVSNSQSSATPWRRSVSRDLASDIDSVFSDRRTPTHTATFPRGDKLEEDRKENLNLSDLNLKKLKLTEEDALALSYLTPGLSRRIQKQLFASLPPSEARKISRTLSMREEQKNPSTANEERRSVDRISRLSSANPSEDKNNSSTLPRRFSYGYSLTPTTNSLTTLDTNQRSSKLQQQKSPESGSTSTTRKISRFLRPDFYDQPKETSTFEKEKKERELETQKVLKEIRDKRIKNRISMRRERSMSREKSEDGEEKMIKCKDLVEALTGGAGKTRVLEDSKLRDDDESRISRRFRNDEDSQKCRDREDSCVRKLKSDEDSRYSKFRDEDLRYSKDDARRGKQEDDLNTKIGQRRDDNFTSRFYRPKRDTENKTNDSNVGQPLKSPLNENKSIEDTTNKISGTASSGLKSPLEENKTIGRPSFGLKSPLNENKSIGQHSIGLKSPLDENKTISHSSTGIKSPLNENKTIGQNSMSTLKTLPDDNRCISELNGNNNSREIENINEEIKSRDTESLLKNVSDNIKNIESNILSNSQQAGAVKKERVSKLIRPKSYPSENGGGRKSGQTSPTEEQQENSEKAVDVNARNIGPVKKSVKTKENSDTISSKLKENSDSSNGKLKDISDSSIGKLKDVNDSGSLQIESNIGQVRKYRTLKDKTSSSVDDETPEVKAVKRLSLPEGKFVEDVQQDKSKLVKLKSKISKSSKTSSESGGVKKVSSKIPDKSELTAEKSVLVSEKGKATSDTNLNSMNLKTSHSMDLNSEKTGIVRNINTESTSNKSSSSKSSSSEKYDKASISPSTNSDLASNRSKENLDLMNGNFIPNSSAKSPVENVSKNAKKADFFKTVYSELNSRKDMKTKKGQDDGVNDGTAKITDEIKSTEDKNGNSILKSSGRKSSNGDSDMTKANPAEDEAGSKSKSKSIKLKKSTTQPGQSTAGKNKFLQSIEKKIEKLRSFNAEEKSAKPGGVETTIKRLREQSVPRNADPITESTLIKRAVSVEDFSNVKNKALQPSRKSVTKILGLFKKYEDKSPKSPENVDPITMLQNIRESNIPMVKGKEKERPKSLQVNKISKLPVNAHRKSLSLESKEELGLEKNDEGSSRRKSLGLEGKEDFNGKEGKDESRSQKKVLSLEGRDDSRRNLNFEGKEDVRKNVNLEEGRKLVEGKVDSLLQRKSVSTEGTEDGKLRRINLEERDEACQLRKGLISPEDNYQAHRRRTEKQKLLSNNKTIEDANNIDELNLQRTPEDLNGERSYRTDFSNSEYEDGNQRRSYEEGNVSTQRRNCSNSDDTRKPYGKTYAQRKTSNSTNNNEDDKKTERKNLKLDFSSSTQDLNLNRISYATDDNSTLLSPFDETTSCDSWSVCSDFHHTQDLSSPLSPNGNTYSGDENDSVIDRIRRKSFYTRFNEKPKPKSRKSLIGNYKDLDLYKDYKEKSLPRYKDYSGSRRSSGYLASSGEIENEYRPYVRSKSVSGGGEYSGGIPNRYQTYNPRRSNMSSLYGHEDGITEDLNTTGLYKKYTSRLGSLSRASRSPSSDFQYIPHSHATSPSSSTYQHHHHQTTENGHSEHAV